jgi:L-alanine-DL-glutamate epimerase-like enolase superfamily enzyme
MKITAVKTAATAGHCMHLWVKIETDEGITGLGECVHGGYAAIALIHQLRPKLVGRDPFAIDALFEELRRGLVFEGGFAGGLITALSGIEIALFDLKGRALGVPVYELLGGKFRDKVRVYADCQVEPGMNFDAIRGVVNDVLARGFTAFKIDLDIHAYGHAASEVAGFVKDRFNQTAGEWEHDRMVRLVEMARKAAGAEIAVACDVHTRLDVTSAIRLARDLEQFHLLWLEEPVPPENVDAMREVKRSTTTPICAGENLYLRQGFRDLIEKQAVDIIMPDIPKCGGLSECRKIANLAETYYMPFAPHNVSSPIGTMASAHVCATVPNFLVLEFHWLHRDYWATITTDKEDIIKDGFIALPARPGVGLDLDETVARAHQYPDTTWFA